MLTFIFFFTNISFSQWW